MARFGLGNAQDGKTRCGEQMSGLGWSLAAGCPQRNHCACNPLPSGFAAGIAFARGTQPFTAFSAPILSAGFVLLDHETFEVRLHGGKAMLQVSEHPSVPNVKVW